MSYRGRAVIVLILQCALVITIAIKFAWERKTRPRVWARAEFVDPNLPLRGRYLNPSVDVDACGMKEYHEALAEQERTAQRVADAARARGQQITGSDIFPFYGSVPADVKPVDDRLVAVFARNRASLRLQLRRGQDCHYVPALGDMPFFVPDTAHLPTHLNKGEELWMQVTLPPEGPPRPIQLALKRDGVWTPLNLR
jgi:hypothetical protein